MKKELGQIFTPKWIVDLLLDFVGYNNKEILYKKVIEPSCGDGAFLMEIVKRYIDLAIIDGWSKNEIKQGIETYIYGIEFDEIHYVSCINNLNKLVNTYEIDNVNWNIKNTDSLKITNLNNEMDFVVGNPPYVRVHNLDIESRNYLKNNYSMCKSGTTDLYIAFYELGLHMLKDTGKLSYITPNTFMFNNSSKNFRKYIEDNSFLSKMINFGSEKVFDVSTYVAIVVLDKEKKDSFFDYHIYKNNQLKFINTLNIMDFSKSTWCFTSEEDLTFLKKSLSTENNIGQLMNVQYGFATLRDNIYISDQIEDFDNDYYLFNGHKIEKELLKPIAKGSKYDGGIITSKIIFPYKRDDNDKLLVISELEMKNSYPYTYEYLIIHKDELLKRDMDTNFECWYQFGRSQGLQSANKPKLVVNTFVKGGEGGSIVIHKCDKEVLVYSGIFITGENLDFIQDILKSVDFFKYVSIVGKDLQNGYKSLSTKIIKNYSLDFEE
jgi:adenine-specific DNA-methyltransferase